MPRPPVRLTGAALAAALLLSPAAPATAEERAVRLFVADRDLPQLTVVDLEAGQVLDRLSLPGTAGYMAPGATPRDLLVVHPKAGMLSRVDTGVGVEDHGDHADLRLTPPAVAPAVLQGEKPSHIAMRDGQVALFLDGGGEALLAPLQGVATAGTPVRRVASGLAHHGIAIPAGDGVVISVATPQGDRAVPDGLAWVTPAGRTDWRGCPKLHGEAVVEPAILIGCENGVAQVEIGPEGKRVTLIPYPADAGEGERVWTLQPVPGLTAAMGEAGRRGLFLVDSGDSAITRIALPGDRVHAIPDPERFAHALVLTADGRLHRLSLLDGTVANSVAVTGPVNLADRSGPPRPSLAAAAGLVAVLDPARGQVVRLDGATLQETGRVRLDGTPARMAAVGARGHRH